MKCSNPCLPTQSGYPARYGIYCSARAGRGKSSLDSWIGCWAVFCGEGPVTRFMLLVELRPGDADVILWLLGIPYRV